ncbi:hypothetical protein GCM10025794_01230 [Massilia kyonggiensis]
MAKLKLDGGNALMKELEDGAPAICPGGPITEKKSLTDGTRDGIDTPSKLLTQQLSN